MILRTGLYEQVISQALESGLQILRSKGLSIAFDRAIDKEEARIVLSRYMAEVMERGLGYIRERYREQSLEKQVEACNDVIECMAKLTDSKDLLGWRIGTEAKQLMAILDQEQARQLGKTASQLRAADVIRPETSLAISELFTGSSQGYSMMNELKKEIRSADRIDLLVSFVKWSGLRLLIEDLRSFTRNGRLRIITTSYMGATDVRAILELADLPNTEVKISYDTRSTRLHAKSYMFYRETGFSTIYIGSSNLSSAAIGDGLEWNVKVTEKDMPHVVRNVQATFETYWNDNDFQLFEKTQLRELAKAISSERMGDYSNREEFQFHIEPYPFQKEILERIEAEREVHGRYRNLVVAATGTGKTVISAFDYKRFCRMNSRKGHDVGKSRLLFIAHRQEILEQSRKCYRGILHDSNFGECWYGGVQPSNWDYLFMSIQTFNSKEFQDHTPRDYYDFIVIDEFHHAAAESYQALLSWYQPKVLLGLTATPERMDGKDIVGQFFDGVMAAEIRLPEAINRQLLVPFQYFGITDEADLSRLKFERGRYDVKELENLYTNNDMRALSIVRAVKKYVTDLDEIIGLGFCVGVEHAKFMAKRFSEFGIPSIALWGGSSNEERQSAQRRLVTGEVRFIFTVDLYNEGVDIPEINTVLFLRPTESMTVFLQQLGRGLRICEGKNLLTVLDFIGQAHRQYSFESKFRALMGRTHRSLQKELEQGFSALPRGCWIELEKVAKETIFKNIKDAVIDKRRLVERIRRYEQDTDSALSLVNFLRTYETIEAMDIYKKWTFSELCIEAGVLERVSLGEPKHQGKKWVNGFRKIAQIDSRRWIDFLMCSLAAEELEAGILEKKMLNMFHYTIWEKKPFDLNMHTVQEGIQAIKSSPHILNEMLQLLSIRREKIRFIDKPLDVGFPCPLDLHCAYTRDQILAALGYWDEEKRPEMREGALYLKNLNTDVFFINLNKSEKDYSPTTMYEDYAISETLFHWQSQSTITPESPTGQRYIHHQEWGHQILLFVRECKSIDGITQPYVYLGKAHYIRHEGSKPISIQWRLEEPMPPWLLLIAMQASVG